MLIFLVFETDVFVVERLVCYIKRRKSFSHPLFFAICDMEIPGVTGGYKGLQKVTGGYKGRHGVTRDDRGLHTIIQTFFN